MFYNFIKELRNRFILLFLTWSSVVIVSYLYKEILIFIFVKPSLNAFQENSFYFIFTNLTDIFSTYLRLVYFLGNQILFFFFFYHLFLFIAPGLYHSEYINFTKLLCLSLTFWICSVFVLNKYLLPFSWQFFLSFQTSATQSVLSFYLEAKINEYINFYINLYYICGLNFQLFILFFIFLDHIKENLASLKVFRKFFYFSFFLIATFLTPPDVFSQVFVGLSSIIVYELTIISIILKANMLRLV
jgi:sec-independent protein translocase protein TatC